MMKYSICGIWRSSELFPSLLCTSINRSIGIKKFHFGWDIQFLGIPRMAVSKISDTSCASVIITFLGLFITDYNKERVLELNLHDLKQDAQVCHFSKRLLMLADFI